MSGQALIIRNICWSTPRSNARRHAPWNFQCNWLLTNSDVDCRVNSLHCLSIGHPFLSFTDSNIHYVFIVPTSDRIRFSSQDCILSSSSVSCLHVYEMTLFVGITTPSSLHLTASLRSPF